MTQLWVLAVFLVLALIAVILVFLYCKWLDKNYNLPGDAQLDNKGVAIKGGLKHFKIVNR
jgi:hypothetical protein